MNNDKCNCNKLPFVNKYNLLRCIEINMSNGEQYVVKQNDLVGIQFTRGDKILVRKGRVKDIVLINRRGISTVDDNVSNIVLDCSEQFTVKTIEIRLKDIIKIGNIEDHFDDYNNRITELDPNFIEDTEDGTRIPVRDFGMYTEEDWRNKITKPDKEDVVKVNPSKGRFEDIPAQKTVSQKSPSTFRGFPLMR